MDWVIVAATVVIACSAVASLWITWRLSEDNRALRRAGTGTEVVAYLGLDQQSGFLVNLVLENVGQGPACDVEYFVEADPQDFAVHKVKSVPARTTRKIRSLLPQGERVERFMGVGNRLYSEDEEARLRPFLVRMSYSNLQGMHIGPKEYPLDVAELGGALMNSPAEERMADSVKKIEQHLGHFSSGFKRLRVETITTAERRAEDEEWRARWEEESATSDKDEGDIS